MTASWTFRLPFYEFENNLRLIYNPISLPSPPRGYIVEDQAADGDIGEGFTSFQDVSTLEGQLGDEFNGTAHAVANAWTPDISDFSALESVVPQTMVDESLHGFPLTHLDIQVFTSPLHRQILYSLANNLAGLDRLPTQEIINFLQKESDETLYRTIRSAQGYTARAIIHSLFKAALEAGDARIVDILIRDNPAYIKINERCIVDDMRYTPIERAIKLGHEELVEIFLSHGAEVNGSLDFAIMHGVHGANSSLHRILRSLFEKEKGAQLGSSALDYLLRLDGELAVLIMSARARENAAQWCRWGLFCNAIKWLDDLLSMKIIEIMLECGVDLNHCVVESGPFPYREDRVMDIAAQRGQIYIVDLLLKSGASLTGNTLPCAVKSQNKDLIELLLGSGADINSIGSLQITTLSVAIELRDDHMIRFLEDQGASVIDQSKEHCSAAVVAASRVGDIQYIERLIKLGGKVRARDLGYGLLIATIDDRDEDVKKLIDAGADVNFNMMIRDQRYHYESHYRDLYLEGPPLREVLERRNESLTFLLLNADADPNLVCRSSIQLAVEWGNRSVIEALIVAGVDVNNCYEYSPNALAIAVKRRDFELIELLLASGAEINSYSKKHNVISPLEAAAEIGDIEMARYLIDQGADPNNSPALEMSFEKNQEMFDLLCQTYRARYPSARGDFGIRLLMQVIENENHDAIKRMLQDGINPDAMFRLSYDDVTFCKIFRKDYGFGGNSKLTAFGYAIFGEKEDITEYLLQYGCDPNSIVFRHNDIRSSAVTAIVAAITTRRISMVELLINHRAKVNFSTLGPIKRTPLQKAAELGDVEIVTLLINNGAEVNAPAAYAGGGTSLQLAAIGGYIPVACKLLNHKADVNAPGSKLNGRTALEGAAEHGRLDMIKLLLNAGAGSRCGDEEQVANAIALAREYGFFYICDLLESHFHRRKGQDSEPGMLLDGSDDHLPEWNLDEDHF